MKKILLAALFAPVMALAQTYPSPTFNSLTLQKPLTTANGGTGATTSTGTGSAVLSNSPTLTTPALGTPSSITLTNGTGLPISTGVSGLGTGVAAGLANAVTGSGGAVLATSPSIANPTITGTFAATGLVTPADLASQAANTMLANAAGVSASPTAIAMPSCSTSSSALQWAAGAGPACNTSINAATLGGATFASPGSVGTGTPGTGAFTTLSATTSSGNSIVVNGTANTTSGAQIELSGNGATTPNKYIRAFGGNFQIVNSANSAVIFGLTDSGVGSFGNTTDWLSPIINCTANCASLWAQSPAGEVGSLGATRTSDNTLAGSMAAQGIAGYVINNNATQVQTGYAGYFEARKSNGAGSTQGLEIDMVNQGSVVNIDPYGMATTGITPALWLSSGRSDVTSGAANATAAIGVLNNNTAFENGIVFGSTSLDNSSGEAGALVMPATYGLKWYGSAGNLVARVRSDATSASGGIVFGNGSINFQNTGGSELAVIDTTAGSLKFYQPPTTGWQHDATNSTVSIANGGNAVLAAGNGMIFVEDSVNSHSAGYLCSAGTCTQFAGNGSAWVSSTTSPTSGHLSVAYNGSTGYAIYNNEGATETVTVGSMRMKAGN